MRHGRIVIGLGAGHASVVHLESGWKSPVVQLKKIALPHDASDFDGMVGAIADSLESLTRRVRVEVVLSSCWARFALLPPSGELRTESERLDLTQHIFDRQYGSLASGWSLLVDSSASGETALACGIPIGLLESLRRGLAGMGRLVSIRPKFMDVFNIVCRSIGPVSEYLAMNEPGRLTLAEVKQGRWLSISSRAVAPGDGSALSHLLKERNALRRESVGGRLWLYDPCGGMNPPDEKCWSVSPIPRIPYLDEASGVSTQGTVA